MKINSVKYEITKEMRCGSIYYGRCKEGKASIYKIFGHKIKVNVDIVVSMEIEGEMT